MESTLALIIIMLIFSAFFSGIEIAYLTSNKLRIELKSQRGVFTGRILSYFIKKPSHFFTTTLVGNNIALVLFSILIAKLVDSWLFHYTSIRPQQEELVVLIDTIIGSIIVLIFGEFLPKALFRITPNSLLTFLALPFLIIYYLLYPLVIFIDFISGIILKGMFKTDKNNDVPEYTRHDLFHIVEQNAMGSEQTIEVDKQIFKNAIEFPSVKVRECMIPRTEIEAVEVTSPVEEAKKGFIESGHSKLLVYRESIDNIIGYIHLVDLYKSPASLDQIVMPIIIATEAMPASELMKILIEKRRSVAVVVDEFGGTSGIITIEDIIEEIIGDIEDEHDEEEFVEKQISENEFIFSARLEIDYLNETFNINLPEGDYETLGGLLFYIHQHIPDPNDVISLPPFEFTVLSTEQTRIKEVHVKITEETEE